MWGDRNVVCPAGRATGPAPRATPAPCPLTAGVRPPGAALVVSQQFGINQTDVFVINNEGALTVTWVFEGGL
jgi:hypothetical protein